MSKLLPFLSGSWEDCALPRSLPLGDRQHSFVVIGLHVLCDKVERNSGAVTCNWLEQMYLRKLVEVAHQLNGMPRRHVPPGSIRCTANLS